MGASVSSGTGAGGTGASRIPPPVTIPPAPTTPADIAALDPLEHLWPQGTTIRRVYDVNWGSRDFYANTPTRRARFSPFVPAGVSEALPVLYGADDDLGALSETVFHDVPVTGPAKFVPSSKLLHEQLIELEATRDLRLVDLTTDGLSRLGLTRLQLIESDPRSYAETAEWARALHGHPSAPDGLYWVSRQHDTSMCVVLFGDRVAKNDLRVAQSPPLPLAFGAGYDRTGTAATRAGIVITGIPAI